LDWHEDFYSIRIAAKDESLNGGGDFFCCEYGMAIFTHLQALEDVDAVSALTVLMDETFSARQADIVGGAVKGVLYTFPGAIVTLAFPTVHWAGVALAQE